MTKTRTITGWLFDVYPSRQGITLWLVDRDGAKHCCWDGFAPWFYMHVPGTDEARVLAIVRLFPFRVSLDRTTRREIYADEEWNVLRVTVHDTLHLRDVVRRLEPHFPHFVFFDSDISPQQLYLYRTGLFPLACGEYTIDEEGRLISWNLDDDPAALEYVLPPLVTMTL